MKLRLLMNQQTVLETPLLFTVNIDPSEIVNVADLHP